MPIVKPRERPDTPETRALTAELTQPTQLGPATFGMIEFEERRGLLERISDANQAVLEAGNDPNNLVSAHLRRSGVVSGFSLDLAPYMLAGISAENNVDPNFNPYDLLDTDFANNYPFMVQHFESGRVLDLPNEDAFWRFTNRQEQDFTDRETMGRYGIGTNFIAAAPALAADTITAGMLLRAFGLGNSATQLTAWTQKGRLINRAGRTGAVAGALNLGQEELLRVLNPDRNVDEIEAAAMAFGMGFAFGGTVPAVVSFGRSASLGLATPTIRRIQSQTMEYFATPRARNAEELIASSRQELQDLLESNETPTSLTAVVSDETRPLINQLTKKYPDLEVVAHPDQASVDWLSMLRRQEQFVDKALTASGNNPVANRFAQVSSFWAPGGKLRASGNSLTRRAGRILFDDTTAIRESVVSPVTTRTTVPAEAVKWNYDQWRGEAYRGIERHMVEALQGRGKTIQYAYADGQTVTLSRKNMSEFGRMVVDYTRRLDRTRRMGQPAPDAPAAVKSASDDMLNYLNRMGDEAHTVRFLDEPIDRSRIFLPQRWKVHEIQSRAQEWQDRLFAAALRNREVDFKTGRLLDESDRDLLDGVVDFKRDGRQDGRGLTDEERSTLRGMIDEYQEGGRGTPTEADLRADLGEDFARRYNEEVELYIRGQVQSTYNTMVLPESSHGVSQAMTTSPFQRRLLDINQDDFADFLVSDLGGLIGGYHNQTAGRIAARYAIRQDTDLIRDLKASGFDLEAKNYDPRELLRAVASDFDEQIRVATGAGDERAVARVKADRARSLKILEAKLEELEGVPAFSNNPAAGAGWKLAQKMTLALPATAFLGKVTVTSFTDIAAQVFAKGLTPRHIRGTARAINVLREVPDYGLEALYAANTDAIRSLRLVDLDDLGESAGFAPGRMGRVLDATDRITDRGIETFFRMSGMNRWNNNQKRWVATMRLAETVQQAKLMARAHRLVRDGMDEAQAIKQVGLSEADARQLNRLGINGARADRLMKVMTEHGQALDIRTGTKRPWSNQAEFEQYKGYVSPEFYAWWKQDRDLYDTLTSAINRMVLDDIVEPKIGSRPLANRTWIGRVFNQFQAFAFAWGNQHAHLAAQRPLYEQINAVLLGVGIAGVVDAIHNQLSGRRSFAETAEKWEENPTGMIYGAINRSALTSWLSRPIGLLDQTPWGPGALLDNTELSGTYSRPIEPSGFLLGPFGSWADQSVAALMKSAYEGNIDDRRARQIWNSLPYHNLWFIEGALRAAEEMGVQPPRFTQPRTP